MRRVGQAVGWCVGTALLLSACQLATGVQKQPKKVTPTAAQASAKPSVQASLKPGAQPTLKPGAQPTAAPIDASKTLLAGTLKMDANYVVAAGGGNVIAAGGGNVIAAGGGNVIAAGGGNVIAAGGGNVIAAGGGNYQVLAADVPVGTMLPAQGMVVVPISLVTGKPVGEAVFTDAKGHYEVAIPKAFAENVRLVAAVPAMSATDPILSDRRLQYTVVTQPTAGAAIAIDEDTALISRYLQVVVSHQVKTYVQDALQQTPETLAFYPEQFRMLLEKAKAVDPSKMPEARQKLLYDRLTDLIMSASNFDAIKTRDGKALVVPLMVKLLRDTREAAAAKLTANPEYFEDKDYIRNQGAGCTYVIKKPADLGDFLVYKYLYDGSTSGLNRTGAVLEELGLAASRKDELDSGAGGIKDTIMAALQNPVLADALIKVFDGIAAAPLPPETGLCD